MFSPDCDCFYAWLRKLIFSLQVGCLELRNLELAKEIEWLKKQLNEKSHPSMNLSFGEVVFPV